MHRTYVEESGEEMKIFRRSLAVIVAGLIVRVTKATQIDRKGPVACCEQWNHLSKRPPRFGKSMHQQNRRTMVSRGDIMQPCSVEFDFMIRNLGESGTLRRDLHKLLLISGNPLRFIFNVFAVPIVKHPRGHHTTLQPPRTLSSFRYSYCVPLAACLIESYDLHRMADYPLWHTLKNNLGSKTQAHV